MKKLEYSSDPTFLDDILCTDIGEIMVIVLLLIAGVVLCIALISTLFTMIKFMLEVKKFSNEETFKQGNNDVE